jgi:hypothetical protein
MLDMIAVILIVLWLLGMVTGYRFGDAIYLLAIAGVALIVVRLVTGRTA